MSAKNLLVVLGASDPEMAAIESLAIAAGCRVAYAVVADSSPAGHTRVHPGNAYRATGYTLLSDPDGYHHNSAWADVGVMVECAPAGWRVCSECDTIPCNCGCFNYYHPSSHAAVIDHHKPGDPGYGKGPEEFWAASSIGQFVEFLRSAGRLGDYDAYWGGDTGEDHGVFAAGVFTDLPSAIKATEGVYAPCWYYGRGVDIPITTPEANAMRDRLRNGAVPSEEVTQTHLVVWIDGGGSWSASGFAYNAAADHCLEAAYRGRCPGIHPDALMRWRAFSRAVFQKRPVAEVLDDVERARQRLREAVCVCPYCFSGTGGKGWCRYCNGSELEPTEYVPSKAIADLRGESIPELPEAAAREGIPFLADQTDRDGRKKVVLMAAPPELVTLFLAGEIVPGLRDMYGDPARGFAGGYKE